MREGAPERIAVHKRSSSSYGEFKSLPHVFQCMKDRLEDIYAPDVVSIRDLTKLMKEFKRGN